MREVSDRADDVESCEKRVTRGKEMRQSKELMAKICKISKVGKSPVYGKPRGPNSRNFAGRNLAASEDILRKDCGLYAHMRRTAPLATTGMHPNKRCRSRRQRAA